MKIIRLVIIRSASTARSLPKARQLTADIGGNLNIESLPGTASFDSKSQNVSVSATVGFGISMSASFNQSKIKNDYASVRAG